MIDLVSDTATRPTPAMREAMASAEVGDDMLGEDPTVNRLEAEVAELFQKEAAVFACSGTQSNQMGVRLHCRPGDELLIEQQSHIAHFEGGAAAALSGVSIRTVAGENGMLDVPHLQGNVHADNQHLTQTRLVCVENTTNVGGGRAYPLDQLQRVGQWAHEHGLKAHLDGARLFNAAVARGYSVADACRTIDTISVCFSKGLGCPMGSVLIGSADDIARARRFRKIFGGALRQAGIVAAAALYALHHHVDRLADDHANARALAESLQGIDGVCVDPEAVETNLVYIHVAPEWGTAAELSAMLRGRGVRIGAIASHSLRACTHLDVTRDDVLQAGQTIQECLRSPKPRVERATPYGPFFRA